MHSRKARKRQCPRCGHWWPGKYKRCPEDQTDMVRHRFVMNKRRIKIVHTVARARKGLTREDYELHLQRVGVESCKDMGRAEYLQFMRNMRRLPDAPDWAPRR